MNFKKLLNMLWFCIFCVLLYYLYIYGTILKKLYIDRENRKKEVIEKIDASYKEREEDFFIKK